jgi:hypothetical protein
VAEWFKAAVLKTARGFTLPRGFESHPFRHLGVYDRPPPSVWRTLPSQPRVSALGGPGRGGEAIAAPTN